MTRRRQTAALIALTLGITVACSDTSRSPGAEPPFRPGEADPDRSSEARRTVQRCAGDRGWELGDLELLVDADSLLIRLAYRSRPVSPDEPERQVVDLCLAQAGVIQPPAGA